MFINGCICMPTCVAPVYNMTRDLPTPFVCYSLVTGIQPNLGVVQNCQHESVQRVRQGWGGGGGGVGLETTALFSKINISTFYSTVLGREEGGLAKEYSVHFHKC